MAHWLGQAAAQIRSTITTKNVPLGAALPALRVTRMLGIARS